MNTKSVTWNSDQIYTVQLSSKAMFARIQNTPLMHPRRVLHASCMCSGWKRAWQLIKSCCSFIMRFCTCMDVSCVHSGCVSHMFRMHLMCMLERECSWRVWTLPRSWAVPYCGIASHIVIILGTLAYCSCMTWVRRLQKYGAHLTLKFKMIVLLKYLNVHYSYRTMLLSE